MRPISYTKISPEEVKYHYSFSVLREFLTHGFKEGNNGFLLVKEEKDFFVYKGFGTIENPCLQLRTIKMQHDSIFDGGRRDPEFVVNPPKQEEGSLTSFRMILWNVNGKLKI